MRSAGIRTKGRAGNDTAAINSAWHFRVASPSPRLKRAEHFRKYETNFLEILHIKADFFGKIYEVKKKAKCGEIALMG